MNSHLDVEGGDQRALDAAILNEAIEELADIRTRWGIVAPGHGAYETTQFLTRQSTANPKAWARLVADPLTPKDILFALAPKFPGEFFLNPALDLFLLEDPALFDKLPVTVIKNVLRRPDCPPGMLEWALHHGRASHHLALVARPGLPIHFLSTIASGPHVKAAEIAATRLMALGPRDQ